MKIKISLFVAVAIVLAACGFVSAAQANIAKVSKFTGEVIVQSGGEISRLTAPGVLLKDGDRIQTKQGDAEVLFNDGAVMKINPFSTAMIQEMKEQKGFWMFKTKVEVRRITCLLGKLFFRSGASAKKNFLQTATAVAGIRGSAGDIGFDNLNSYLHMYEGEAAVIGSVIRGLFENPGISAAEKNAIYTALANAYTQKQSAAGTGSGVDDAKAGVTAAEVGKLVADTLKNNPDPAVKENAEVLEQTANSVVSSANAKVAVEEIKEKKANAEKALAEARQSGDEKAIREAEQALEKVNKDLLAAQQAAAEAKAAAEAAAAALAADDLDAAKNAAKDAEAAAKKAAGLSNQGAQPTTVSTTSTSTTTTSTSTTTITPSR